MIRSLIIFILLFNVSAPISFASEFGIIDFNNGIKYFKQKKYKSALEQFKKARKSGMNKSSLDYNIGVSYYKLGNYKKAEINFKRLINNKKFYQIANYNLALIAEKNKKNEIAIKLYNKVVKDDQNYKLTQLANIQLDKLLNRKPKRRRKGDATVRLTIGNDDNITNAAVSSPSNKRDQYQEIFAYFKTPVSNKINFKGTLLLLNYSTVSTENYSFYTAALDYSIIAGDWKIIPEISLLQSSLNNSSYQNNTDIKIFGIKTLKNNALLSLRYRYSDIKSQNTLYNYLQGSRHQFRVDYKAKLDNSRLRLRYQLETNKRNNSATANYSPTRHTFRARLKHNLTSNWKISEEIGYRISQYGDALGVVRRDNRLRLRATGSKKFTKKWTGGIRYTYTNNSSNVNSENYTRNNIQFFANLDF